MRNSSTNLLILIGAPTDKVLFGCQQHTRIRMFSITVLVSKIDSIREHFYSSENGSGFWKEKI